MKIAFLFNPSPSSLATIPDLQKQIHKYVAVEKSFFKVNRSQPQSIENELEQILRGGFDRLCVVGGDGTLNRTINFLKNQNSLERFIFSILPYGTCNDFAKTLGFPTLRFKKIKVIAALKALTKNDFREIRIGQVNQHYFINNIGFGRRNFSIQRRSAISDIRSMVLTPMQIFWNETTLKGEFLMMICANAPFFSNGLHFFKESDPSDDILEFFFVKNVNKIRLLTKLFFGKRGLPLGRSLRRESLHVSIHAPELTFQAQAPVWIMADGESVPSLSGIYEATIRIATRCRFIIPKI